MWQPYEAILGCLLAFYVAVRDMWKAIVLLVCFYIVETHYPDRVLRRFGLVRAEPICVETSVRLHAIDLRGKVDKNWTEVHAAYIEEWDTRQQRVCHAPPQIGKMPRNHAYNRWYRPITRKYVDHNSAKLDIMVMCSN